MRSLAPGLPKWSPAAEPSRALRLDDGEERIAGAIDDVRGEGVLEDDDARAVGQRVDQLGLQCLPVRRRRRGIDEHVLADVDGMRVIGEVGAACHFGAEVVEPAGRLVDPRLVSSGQWCCHGS